MTLSTKKRKTRELDTTVIEIASAAEYLTRENSILANHGAYKLSRGGPGRAELIRQVAAERKRRAEARARDLQDRRAAARAARTMALDTSGEAFYICFMQMGQGDCIVVRTPGEAVVMIDCGSTSTNDDTRAGESLNEVTLDATWSDLVLSHSTATSTAATVPLDLLDKARRTLRQDYLLGASKAIDYLILTHSDADHYNRLEELLGNDITFKEVFHSNDLPLYSVGRTSNYIREHVEDVDSIRRITLNDPANTKVTLTDSEDTVLQVDQDTNGGYLFVDEDNCKLWVLTGDVTAAELGIAEVDGDATEANQRSLVVLIEVFGQKILLCGDACRSTEAYLLRKCKAAITDLDLLQIPHHGSDTTSSSAGFINATNAKAVITSVARKDNQHNLPKMPTLSAYYRKMKASGFATVSSPNYIFYWARGGMGSLFHCISAVDRPFYTTGSQGTSLWKVYQDDDEVKSDYVSL